MHVCQLYVYISMFHFLLLYRILNIYLYLALEKSDSQVSREIIGCLQVAYAPEFLR